MAVTAASAALGRGTHPLIAAEIARFMLKVNSYYTNAMEGNPSRLKDIDAALGKSFAKDPLKRHYQLEHLAHIEVEEAMTERLKNELELNPCAAEFLSWLHEEFFRRLPPELRFGRTESGETVPVTPGALRDRGVTVGRHHGPPTRAEIEGYLSKFQELLDPNKLSGPRKLLGMASAHHRLLWIHPYAEGNGRVARLMTTAYGIRVGIGETRLWTVARAFARDRAAYDANLAHADLPRRNDLDGRGPLSEEGLLDFCEYFLRCCLDQIGFMNRMLELHEFELRHARHIRALVAAKRISKAGARVMDRLLGFGEIPRARIREICTVKPRRASQIAAELLKAGVVHSETPYAPLRISISADMAAVLFPEIV